MKNLKKLVAVIAVIALLCSTLCACTQTPPADTNGTTTAPTTVPMDTTEPEDTTAPATEPKDTTPPATEPDPETSETVTLKGTGEMTDENGSTMPVDLELNLDLANNTATIYELATVAGDPDMYFYLLASDQTAPDINGWGMAYTMCMEIGAGAVNAGDNGTYVVTFDVYGAPVSFTVVQAEDGTYSASMDSLVILGLLNENVTIQTVSNSLKLAGAGEMTDENGSTMVVDIELNLDLDNNTATIYELATVAGDPDMYFYLLASDQTAPDINGWGMAYTMCMEIGAGTVTAGEDAYVVTFDVYGAPVSFTVAKDADGVWNAAMDSLVILGLLNESITLTAE